MKRADAQKAIDEAFADGLKNLFDVLQRNMLAEDHGVALKQFRAGIARHDEAHSAATAEIEKIFGE
jgi:hypothetical protein